MIIILKDICLVRSVFVNLSLNHVNVYASDNVGVNLTPLGFYFRLDLYDEGRVKRIKVV